MSSSPPRREPDVAGTVSRIPGREGSLVVGAVPMEVSLLKPKQKHVQLSAMTAKFMESSLDEQLHSLELDAIPLKSSVAIQKKIAKDLTKDEDHVFAIVAEQLEKDDATLVRARLSGMHVTDTILNRLIHGLSVNTYLQHLMLNQNSITDVGVELLCGALRNHPNLHTLWMGGNRITDVGMRHLALLCHRNDKITQLNVANKWPNKIWAKREFELHPYITHIGAEILASQISKGSSLTSISLAEQRVGDEGAIMLFNVLSVSNIRSLNLSANELSNRCGKSLQDALASDPILQQLNLSKNEIGNEAAVCIADGLADNSNICVLDLSHNVISNAGLRALQTCLNLNSNIQSLLTIGNKTNDHQLESFVCNRSRSIIANSKSNLASMSSASRSSDHLYDESSSPVAGKHKSRMLLPELAPLQIGSMSHSSSGFVSPNKTTARSRKFGSFAEMVSTPFRKAEGSTPFSGIDISSPSPLVAKHGKTTRKKSMWLEESGSNEDITAIAEDDRENEGDHNDEHEDDVDYAFTRRVRKMAHRANKAHGGRMAIEDAIATAVQIVNLCEKESEEDRAAGGSRGVRRKQRGGALRYSMQLMSGADNGSHKISSALNKAIKFGESASDDDSNSLHGSLSESSDESVGSLSKKHALVPTEAGSPLASSRPRHQRRLSVNYGKTLGVPQIQSRGIRPIRTSISAHADSGQHLFYLRVAAEDDPENSRPYSMVTIGLDKRAERERIRKERQSEAYKAAKQELLAQKPKEKAQHAASTRVPEKFWKNWRLKMKETYPAGLDGAAGCTSTQLEKIEIPPPPSALELAEGAVDAFSRYDRTDPDGPWNRFLASNTDPRLAYQKHLGFKHRNFTPVLRPTLEKHYGPASMVYLLTDADEQRLLACPATLSIGRGVDNNIRPESQSVSKHHAAIHTQFAPGTTKIEVYVEDLQSRNGTFVGPSPLEMEKVSGRRLAPPGSFIRFGHAQRYFRILDENSEQNGAEEQLVLPSGIAGQERVSSPLRESFPNNQFPSAPQYQAGTSAVSRSNPKLTFGRNIVDPSQHFDNAHLNLLPGPLSSSGYLNNSINRNNPSGRLGFVSDRAELPSALHIVPFQESIHHSVNEYLVVFRSVVDSINVLSMKIGSTAPSADGPLSTDARQVMISSILSAIPAPTQSEVVGGDAVTAKTDALELPASIPLSRMQKDVESNSDTLLIQFLASNGEDHLTLAHNLHSLVESLLQVVSSMSTYLASDATTEEQSSEINVAVLSEVSSMLQDDIWAAVADGKIDSALSDSRLSDFVESLLKKHWQLSVDHSAVSTSLALLMDAINRNTSSGVISTSTFRSLVERIVKCLCDCALIFAVEYILVLFIQQQCKRELQSTLKVKPQSTNAVISKIREIATVRDASELQATLRQFNQDQMELMVEKQSRLTRLCALLEGHHRARAMQRWTGFTRHKRQQLLRFLDLLTHQSRRQKREAFQLWREKCNSMNSIVKALKRVCRSSRQQQRLLLSKGFRRWWQVAFAKRHQANSKQISMQDQLDYMLLKSQMQQLQSGNSLAAQLLAEKAINRELMAVNDHLRRVMQESCLQLDNRTSTPRAGEGASTHNKSSASSADVALARSETELCKQELSKLKLFLQDKDLWKSATADKSKSQGLNRSPLLAIQSDSSQDSRLNAVRLIEFEIKSLRKKADDLRQSNRQLTSEASLEKIKNSELLLANQLLAGRVSKMELVGQQLRNQLIRRLGDDEFMAILTNLDLQDAAHHWLLANISDATPK